MFAGVGGPPSRNRARPHPPSKPTIEEPPPRQEHGYGKSDDAPQPAGAELRAQLTAADVVLFRTPQYAGALPGSFKNWKLQEPDRLDDRRRGALR
ncbi:MULTISPECIES: NAD(P)H-dependent oxidoreductase [Frankia]|uniref:NAD(P)H-dependent oxidoreductase n=1 Tax=Frankia TaxID=1854 RepID=UPI000423D76D|nr:MULTISPECIES: NAD(P)H-dependent oxidoreductase [Frankia]